MDLVFNGGADPFLLEQVQEELARSGPQGIDHKSSVTSEFRHEFERRKRV